MSRYDDCRTQKSPARTGGWKAGSAVLVLALSAACGELFVAPAPERDAVLSVSMLALANRDEAGDLEAGFAAPAFDAVDRVRIVIRRGDEAIVEETVVFSPEAGEARIGVGVPVRGEQETLLLEVVLLLGEAPVFQSTSSIVIEAGVEREVVPGLEPVPAGIQVPGPVTFDALGDEVQLDGVVTFATGDPIPHLDMTWATPDPDVIQVDPDGRVVALAEGDVTAVGSFDQLEGVVPVRVQQRVVSVDVEPAEAAIDVDGTVQLAVQVRDPRGQPVQGRTVDWASSDPQVADVDVTGQVTGVAEGSTVITGVVEGVQGSANILVTEETLPPLPPDWEGVYAWDCGGGRTGESQLHLTLDDPGTGHLTGTVEYMGGSSTVSGWRIQDPVFGTFGIVGGDVHPEGRYVLLRYPAAEGYFVNNEFSGEIAPTLDRISGTTLNGDTPVGDTDGCSHADGPSGEFSVQSQQGGTD